MINIDHNPVETEDGVWAPKFKGVEFLISHISNMAFQKKLARLQQPHAKRIEKGTLSPDIQKEILCQAMAGTILKGWRGAMVNKDSEPVPFSVEVAEKLLTNNIEVREFVSEYAGNLDNYRAEEVEELGKS